MNTPVWPHNTTCALIFLTLIAALAIVYLAPRNALYQESCSRRSCVKNLSLKCINETCICETGYIYIGKCILKRGYNEKCHLKIICKDNTNMICKDGVCKCDDSKYWNGKSCVSKSTYNQTCSQDEHCLKDNMLYCDIKIGKCSCDNSTR